jgi:hypothetical protein
MKRPAKLCDICASDNLEVRKRKLRPQPVVHEGRHMKGRENEPNDFHGQSRNN